MLASDHQISYLLARPAALTLIAPKDSQSPRWINCSTPQAHLSSQLTDLAVFRRNWPHRSPVPQLRELDLIQIVCMCKPPSCPFSTRLTGCAGIWLCGYQIDCSHLRCELSWIVGSHVTRVCSCSVWLRNLQDIRKFCGDWNLNSIKYAADPNVVRYANTFSAFAYNPFLNSGIRIHATSPFQDSLSITFWLVPISTLSLQES